MKTKVLAVILTTTLVLQGCAAALVAGGVGAASAIHDRRTIGTQIDDKTLSFKISRKIANAKALEQSHINVYVFNGIALLVGQTPDHKLSELAEKLAYEVQPLRKVHNQIRISEPTAAGTRTHDVWLESKVSAKLIADDRVDGLHVAVVVEDSEVFMMGLVKADEANIAVDIVRNINGVTKVVKAFEYL